MDKKIIKHILFNQILDECQKSDLSKQINVQNKAKIYRNILIFKALDIKKKPRKIPKVENYIEKIISYPDDLFKSHFRMKRETFKKLHQLVEERWENSWTGRPRLDSEKSLYLTIWRLSNQTAFRILADRFDVSQGGAHMLFTKMTEIIANFIGDFVKWPKSNTEFTKIMEGFQEMRSERPFPNVIGCIDCTHIQIPSPKTNAASYYNRKGQHSIILQAVCDNKSRFIDTYFGWPGRSHDAAVWRSSPLGLKLENGEVNIPEGSHLLGDSAYPLSTYLLTPHRDNGFLSSTQRKYNYYHSSTRVCIEQAFGVLKGKFRILKFLNIYNIEKAKNIVNTCIVLHNMIINNEELDLESFDNEDEDDNENDNHSYTIIPDNNVSQAKEKRELVTQLFVS